MRFSNLITNSVAVLTALLLGLTGCGGDVASTDGCDAFVGDIVISELMANPEGTDTKSEWFEIYNASSRPQVLDRLVIRRLYFSSEGAVAIKQQTLRGLGTLDAYSYLVLGDGEVSAGVIDYDYNLGNNDVPADELQDNGNESFGALGNERGGLAVACKGKVIDEIWYGTSDGLPEPTEGRSLSYEGDMAPDALLNDQANYWCQGSATYDDDNRGTPGAPNEPCGYVSCIEGNEERDLVEPSLGSVVISEALVNPSSTDTGKEWIEIYVAGDTAVDLNRMVITSHNAEAESTETSEITTLACISGEPGEYLVIGASSDIETNGGVTVDGVASGLSLLNAAGASITISRRNQVLDTVVLGEPEAGVSWMLDDGLLTVDGNDADGAFCEAPDSATGYFEGLGTPGAANGVCGELTCFEDGTLRPTAGVAVGDVIVSEVLANPDGSDGGREWLELYVAADAAVDLNGLVIKTTKIDSGSERTVSLLSDNCLSVTPGGYIVVGASDDTTTNGNVRVDVVADGLNMYNSTELRLDLMVGETVIDTAVIPATSEGQSASVESAVLTPESNDAPDSFCESQTLGSFDGYGTPGEANICGASCLGADGSRTLVAPSEGDLVITEVMANPDGSDAGRDWIELYNPTATAFDLNGLILESRRNNGEGNADSVKDWELSSGLCLTVEPASYVVVSGAGAEAEGIMPVVTIGTASSTLFYGSSMTMVLRHADETVIDASAGPFSPVSGASFSLDPAAMDATRNDDAATWCTATTSVPVDAPFLGTPGSENQGCTE